MREEAHGLFRRVRLGEAHADSKDAVGVLGNLLVLASSSGPYRPFFERALEIARRAAEENPGDMAMIIVIDDFAAPPDGDSRKAIQTFYRELAPFNRYVVHVVEGIGFAAAAKRAFISLLTMSERYGFPARVVGTIEESVPLLRQALGKSWVRQIDAQSIQEAVHELRERRRSIV